MKKTKTTTKLSRKPLQNIRHSLLSNYTFCIYCVCTCTQDLIGPASQLFGGNRDPNTLFHLWQAPPTDVRLSNMLFHTFAHRMALVVAAWKTYVSFD